MFSLLASCIRVYVCTCVVHVHVCEKYVSCLLAVLQREFGDACFDVLVTSHSVGELVPVAVHEA